MVYVTIASLPAGTWTPEISYIIRLLLIVPLLLYFRPEYTRVAGPNSPVVSTITGLLAGLAGTAAWVLCIGVFRDPASGTEWSGSAFCLRLVASTLVVPVFEELLMRGYIFRLVLQWDTARQTGASDPFQTVFHQASVNTVQPGSWSLPAVVISTIIFALGHHSTEWLAASVYGLLMAALWIVRKDLLSCIIAHGTTNLSLAVYVYLTSNWGLW